MRVWCVYVRVCVCVACVYVRVRTCSVCCLAFANLVSRSFVHNKPVRVVSSPFLIVDVNTTCQWVTV